MHIIVDKLPSSPNECIFNRNFNDTRTNGCILNDSRVKCMIGDPNFKCCYLREFKAETREQVTHNSYKIAPVILKED